MKDDQPGDWWMELNPQFEIEELESYKDVKEKLLKNDPVKSTDWSESQWDHMHDQIMAKVAAKNDLLQRGMLWNRARRLTWRASIFAIGLGLSLFTRPVGESKRDGWTVSMEQAAANSKGNIHAIISHQVGEDFLIDMAQQNMN